MLNYKFKKIVQQKILNYKIYLNKHKILEKVGYFFKNLKRKQLKF